MIDKFSLKNTSNYRPLYFTGSFQHFLKKCFWRDNFSKFTRQPQPLEIMLFSSEVTFCVQVHLLWWSSDRWLTCPPPLWQSAVALPLRRIHYAFCIFLFQRFNENGALFHPKLWLNLCLQQVKMQFCHIFSLLCSFEVLQLLCIAYMVCYVFFSLKWHVASKMVSSLSGRLSRTSCCHN